MLVFKTEARFTFDGKIVPNEQAYQENIEQYSEIIIIDDHIDFRPLTYELNVLREAFMISFPLSVLYVMCLVTLQRLMNIILNQNGF